MKQTLVLLAMLFLEYYSSSAQISFGVKGGVNANDVVIKNAPFLPIRTYTPSIGFHIGAISVLHLTRKLSFNPELTFIQKGANSSSDRTPIQGSLTGDKMDVRINLNYLELPLLFSFTPTRLISFDLGPNLGLRISAKGKTENVKSDMSDLFNKPFDFGISGGLKFNLSNKISITSRYYYGLVTPLKFPETSPTPDPPSSGSNRNPQIGISYMLKE